MISKSTPIKKFPVSKLLLKLVKHLLLLMLLLLTLYPFLWLLFSSFKTELDLISNPAVLLPTEISFDAYTAIWERLSFPRYYLNTFIFAFSATILSLLFDSMAGYAFARLQFKGKNVLFIIVLSTMMIPFHVMMIPLFTIISKLNMIDTYWGLIIPRATSAFGIFLMRQFFMVLPKNLEEAARIDGCSEFKIYAKIMVPLCLPAFATLGIFHFMANWNDLLYPLLLTTSNEMRPIQAAIALLVGKYASETTHVLASSILALIPILIAYLFAQKYFIKGIAMTGMKD